jgi:hypothetical protein
MYNNRIILVKLCSNKGPLQFIFDRTMIKTISDCLIETNPGLSSQKIGFLRSQISCSTAVGSLAVGVCIASSRNVLSLSEGIRACGAPPPLTAW